MALTVNTNISSLVAQNSLNKATNSMNTAMERMTTGYKINRAADDAAGLSIAGSFTTQIRGSKVAQNNIQQGINMLQTTEGYLSSMEENVNRIRDLAVQASNGINSTASLKAIEEEANARMTEIDNVANQAEFNGIKLLDGGGDVPATGMRIQVAANSPATENAVFITGVFDKATCSGLGFTSTASAGFADSDKAAAFIAECDTVLAELASRRSSIGAYQNRFESKFDTLATAVENYSAAKSTIMDSDISVESSNFIKSQILQQASASLLASANQTPSIALSLV